MTLNELRDRAYKTGVEKGWYDNGMPNFGERLALIHSEVSEALEDYRTGKPVDLVWLEASGKPCGVPSEMADIIIRVLDMCGAYGIDIEKIVGEKMAYNETRPYKHGKVC